MTRKNNYERVVPNQTASKEQLCSTELAKRRAGSKGMRVAMVGYSRMEAKRPRSH